MSMKPEIILIILCSLVVISYGFSIVSKYIKIPSVLLLLFAGIVFRIIADSYKIQIPVPDAFVEGIGVVGLIMIVLEAGLDLKLSKNKLPLIGRSFLAALVILIVSAVILSGLLYFWFHEDLTKCIVYALPLSIMSSSIVLPSIHHLSPAKKEFLVYEASFSDILGLMFFNYFTAKEILTPKSFAVFGMNTVIAILLSLILSFLLFLILAKAKLNIKFFLVFSLLVLIYSGGKLLHLPSLLIILVFGMMINNWEKIPVKKIIRIFSQKEVTSTREFLHSITAESSFLIRTFFFIFFGFSIDLSFFGSMQVILVGSLMVIALFFVRYFYLHFFFRTKTFPEVFFIPRGLITIVLFYKIPSTMKLKTFNDGILFFIILATGIILSAGMIFYNKKNDDLIEEPQFIERNDIL